MLPVQVKEIIVNNYYGGTLSYSQDIALLVLEKKFEFNNFVSPVCLDEGQLPLTGTGIVSEYKI